jgi:hypothetical protein
MIPLGQPSTDCPFCLRSASCHVYHIGCNLLARRPPRLQQLDDQQRIGEYRLATALSFGTANYAAITTRAA